MNENTLTIQIGDVCCAIRCLDQDILQYLRTLYRKFLCDTAPDIYVELEITDTVVPGMVTNEEENAALFHGDGVFSDSHNLVSGEYNLFSGTVRVRAERLLLTHNNQGYYLNQFICKLYYSAHKIRKLDSIPAFIMHSSAVIYHNAGLLFTGPSGAGKTTIADILGSSDESTVIINDEGNLVSRTIDGKRANIRGIPIKGKLAENNNVTSSLDCILLLKQSNRTAFHSLDKTYAFKKLLRQVVGNLYFGNDNPKSIYSSLAGFSEYLVKNIPCYELEFTLDTGQLNSTLKSLLLILTESGG